jgi:hypothetical protein
MIVHLWFLFVLIDCTRAFVRPTGFVASTRREAYSTTDVRLVVPGAVLIVSLEALPLPFIDNGASTISLLATAFNDNYIYLEATSTPTIVDQVAQGFKTIGTALVSLIAVLALISGVFINYIIPRNAALQLESQVKENYPSLWAEYASKLKEGETLVMRPDVMQELSILYTKSREAQAQARQQPPVVAQQEQNIHPTQDE